MFLGCSDLREKTQIEEEQPVNRQQHFPDALARERRTMAKRSFNIHRILRQLERWQYPAFRIVLLILFIAALIKLLRGGLGL
jgi:hypothetical protein